VTSQVIMNRSGFASFLGYLLASVFVPVGIVHAQDLPPPETPHTPVTSKVQHVAVDASALATSLGDRSLDLNSTFAPFGDINEGGLRIRISGNASWYRFVTNPNPFTLGSGHTFGGGFLAGYQFSTQRANFIGLIGPTLAESNDQGVSRGSGRYPLSH
jgi:hypothetical protein